MVKPRSKQNNNKKVEDVINSLADKPYGQDIDSVKEDKMERITITLPTSIRDKLDDIALDRKRKNLDNKNVSSIIREALDQYLK